MVEAMPRREPKYVFFDWEDKKGRKFTAVLPRVRAMSWFEEMVREGFKVKRKE